MRNAFSKEITNAHEKRIPSKRALPFTWCNLLACLVASNGDTSCPACAASQCFLADQDGIVRKSRRAKLAELQRRLEHRETVFTITGRNIKNRTAKHKLQPAQQHISKDFIVDSGATISTVSDLSLLETIDDYEPNKRVQVANGQFVPVVCTGTVRLQLDDEHGQPVTVLLRDVHYSPNFSHNLLSIDALYEQHSMSTHFSRDSFIKTRDGVRIPINRNGKQYQLRAFSTGPSTAVPVSAAVWHKRFMHLGTRNMQNLQGLIPGLDMRGADFSKCDGCCKGGGKRQPASTAPRRPAPAFQKRKRFTRFGQRIASDLCGPFPAGPDGELYAIIFHDSATKHVAVYTIPNKEKGTVLAAFQRFLSDYSEFLPNGVGEFWTDGGGEYVNSDMDQFCEEICVRRDITVPYQPQQNPYAERTWGDLLRKVRSSLAESNAPHKLWPHAIQQAALVHNIACNSEHMSPYHQLHGEHFNYSRLRAWGCLCYYLVPARDRESKLSPTALPAIYLGFDSERNGHYVYVPDWDRIVPAFHLVFNEDRYFHDQLRTKRRVTFDDSSSKNVPIGRTRREYSDADANTDPIATDNVPRDDPDLSPAADPRHGTPDEWNEAHCENSRCLYPRGHTGPCSHEETHGRRFRPLPRRIYAECVHEDCVFCLDHCGPCVDDCGSRLELDGTSDVHVFQADVDPDVVWADICGPSVYLDDVGPHVLKAMLDDDILDPEGFEHATTGPLAQRWWDSMQAEISALIKNGTWELVSRNDARVRRRKPTKSKWVYKVKRARDGTISKLKSRFCVCGYSQRQGVDYDRAFSATMRATSFRTLLAVAAGKKMRLVHFDVSNAFTQANLDDVDLFVEPPKGFEEWETVNGKRVSKLLHLKRALYGSKQASRLWQETLREYLCSFGFQPSTADPCIYHLKRGNDEIIIGVYVDDIVVAYRGKSLFDEFSASFQKRFTSTFEGDLHFFLGIAVDQHDDFSVSISHAGAIQKMADKYIPHNTSTRECPPTELFNSLDRAQSDEERAKVEAFAYASIVGSLLYVSVMTRPDVAFHTSILAKFMSDPSEDCCKAATQLLQYLVSTKDKCLFFSGVPSVANGLGKHAPDVERNFGFTAYSDSSWGNKYPYPMFGYGIYLYGGLISFASKQLKTVAFSSCEAEYAAAAYCCKEIEFVRNLCYDMGVTLQGRLVLAVDNTACIDVAHDVGVSSRTKHFDRAIHYLRDLTQLRRVVPVHVTTDLQRADGYTKSLSKSAYVTWLRSIFQLRPT